MQNTREWTPASMNCYKPPGDCWHKSVEYHSREQAEMGQHFSVGFKWGGCHRGQTWALQVCSCASKPRGPLPIARGCLHPPHRLSLVGDPQHHQWCFKHSEPLLGTHWPHTALFHVCQNVIFNLSRDTFYLVCAQPLSYTRPWLQAGGELLLPPLIALPLQWLFP